MNLTLTRIMRPGATFGVLSTDDFPLCCTLELAWQNNQQGISCIPPGVYQYEAFESPEHGSVWQIMDVPSRTAILIHEGNFLSDSRGCILAGANFSGTGPAVLNSDITIEALRKVLGTSGQLTIVES